MDDDAALLPGDEIDEALRVFEGDPRIGSVACAMAEADGSPWQASMQPAPVDYTCYVTAYIGFAHLIRKSVFLGLGGYRESFHFYGEEKDLCLRMLQAGFNVVYTPRARVIHTPDPSGRNPARYVRYAIRNDCLFALYNEPLPVLFVSMPIRVARYFKMSRGLHDRGGFLWIMRELARELPAIARGRRAVSWATFTRWRQLSRTWPQVA
jgi:GT2 family glycosyltransferase